MSGIVATLHRRVPKVEVERRERDADRTESASIADVPIEEFALQVARGIEREDLTRGGHRKHDVRESATLEVLWSLGQVRRTNERRLTTLDAWPEPVSI